MHPYLLDFGHFTLPLVGDVRLALPTYGVLVATALVVGWVWFVRRAQRAGLTHDQASTAAFSAMVAGIVGAKLGLVIVEPGYFLGEPEHLLSFEFLSAAGVVWIGVLCGLGAFAWQARRLSVALGDLLDAAALPLPISQAIGRIGCLMAGCCFGSVTDCAWGVTYGSIDAHERTGVPLGIKLHPFPIYESLWCLLVVAPLVWLVLRRRRFAGEGVLAYLFFYGLGRIFTETTRGDAVRGIWFGGRVSTSQLISGAVLLLVAAAWLVGRARARRRAVEGAPSTDAPPPSTPA